MANGRPTDYNEELATKICARISSGQSLRSVCRDDDMPAASSVFLWLTKYPGFTEQYAKATDERAAQMFEDMLDIGDDVEPEPSQVAKARLRVDTRKWALARMNPKKYGDKIENTVVGSDGGPVRIEKIERVILDPK